MADNVVEDAGDGIDPFPFLNFAAAQPRYIALRPSLSLLPVVRRLVAERVPVFDVVVIVGVVDVVAVVAFFCHQ